jgi:hypothetical protein
MKVEISHFAKWRQKDSEGHFTNQSSNTVDCRASTVEVERPAMVVGRNKPSKLRLNHEGDGYGN